MGRETGARRKQLALLAAILGSGVGSLDGTIVNVALPTIQRSLGGGLAGEQWIANGYLLTLGSLILVGGSLEDIFGARRIFSLGVGGFGAISVLCALAPSIGALVAFRALQGVAGAMLIPSSLALIVATFPEAERGAAVGTWTAFTTVAVVIGPLLGGGLLAAGSWRLIFYVNIPFVLICLALIRVAVPPVGGVRRRRRIDFAGALACVLGLAGIVFALIEQPRFGWTSPAVVIPLAGGITALVAFVFIERASADPMLPFGLFRRTNFTATNVETFVIYAGLGVLLFFLILFLQQVAGYSPLASGLSTLPVTVILFLASRPVGALASKHGPRLFMSAGPLLGAGGLLLLLRVGAHASYPTTVLPAIVVFGAGLALTVAPLTATVLACVSESEAGIASAINNAVARVASLVATAATGSVLAAHFASELDSRLHGVPLNAPARSAVLAAKHLALGHPPLHGLAPAAADTISRAATAASVSSFHLAVAIAAALLGIGGVIGGAAIRDPQLVGSPAQRGAVAPGDASSSE